MTSLTDAFPGPEEDGRPTWLMQCGDVPAGYEFRYTATTVWRQPPAVSGDETRWVQVRRLPPAPSDTVFVTVDTDHGLTAVTFAEVCETIVAAVDPVAESVVTRVALAVWQLLTDGEVPTHG